ncbi:MAG TPA: hypothetical protein PLG27_10125, partial [Candidatus Latescibacteria bacterium]|nr:hypothetical protein [Candidatus Latescibacterota bacterium]
TRFRYPLTGAAITYRFLIRVLPSSTTCVARGPRVTSAVSTGTGLGQKAAINAANTATPIAHVTHLRRRAVPLVFRLAGEGIRAASGLPALSITPSL